jgi:hypothetical protein
VPTRESEVGRRRCFSALPLTLRISDFPSE